MQQNPSSHMSKAEFIALIAMMFATIAFSIDAMLPALPNIGAELSPEDVNRAQLILTSFVFGMGLGTFVTGPLSDAFGRKPVIVAGAALYILSAGVAWVSNSLELLLISRVTMGLGAAGPRVVALAIVRDLYSGREMARLMSIAMMIFTLVPAFAPMLGAGIIHFAGWRGIFAAFVIFAMIVVLWMSLRLPERPVIGRSFPARTGLNLLTDQLYTQSRIAAKPGRRGEDFERHFGNRAFRPDHPFRSGKRAPRRRSDYHADLD